MAFSTTNILLAIFTLALLFFVSTASYHPSKCSKPFDQLTKSRNIYNCKKLATLGAHFGWEVDKNNESQIEIIFGARLHADMGWLAWGVNPESRPRMVGTRAFIGIRQLNGSFLISTYNITCETKLGCKLQPSAIDVEVKENAKFEYIEKIDYFAIHVTIILPPVYNISRLNHVWQIGYDADGVEPKMHPIDLQNVDSTETINLKNGVGQHIGKNIHHLRMVHGILNIVGWGVFLPSGAIMARYLKYPLELRKSWFPLHVSCQIVGYTVGTTGLAIGLWLGHASRYYTFRTHLLFAMFIFAFTTLQMLAICSKPNKTHEYRNYWNMYHHFLGYALIVVIAVNIFEGIAILKPDQTWKRAYAGILGFFGILVMTLEVFTWTKFSLNKKDEKTGNESQSNADQPQSSAPNNLAGSN